MNSTSLGSRAPGAPSPWAATRRASFAISTSAALQTPLPVACGLGDLGLRPVALGAMEGKTMGKWWKMDELWEISEDFLGWPHKRLRDVYKMFVVDFEGASIFFCWSIRNFTLNYLLNLNSPVIHYFEQLWFCSLLHLTTFPRMRKQRERKHRKPFRPPHGFILSHIPPLNFRGVSSGMAKWTNLRPYMSRPEGPVSRGMGWLEFIMTLHGAKAMRMGKLT